MIKETIIRYLIDRMSLEEFENWVYETPELEDWLDQDNYLLLVGFDFKSKHAHQDLKTLLRKIVPPHELNTYEIQGYLHSFIDGTEDMYDLLDLFCLLYGRGLMFLRPLAYQYIFYVVDKLDSNTSEIQATKQRFQPYFMQALRPYAEQILHWLQTGAIIIDSSPSYWSFHDVRMTEEVEAFCHFDNVPTVSLPD